MTTSIDFTWLFGSARSLLLAVTSGYVQRLTHQRHSRNCICWRWLSVRQSLSSTVPPSQTTPAACSLSESVSRYADRLERFICDKTGSQNLLTGSTIYLSFQSDSRTLTWHQIPSNDLGNSPVWLWCHSIIRMLPSTKANCNYLSYS